MLPANRVETHAHESARNQPRSATVFRCTIGSAPHTSVLWLRLSYPSTVKLFDCPEREAKCPLGRQHMQVLLRKSNFRQDIQCSVCGQGFRLYWELRSPSERATMRSIVIGELREHHSREQGGDKTAAAHPVDLFRLPTWLGSPEFYRSTLLASPESRIHRAARRIDYISE
jgi:hypothetical protein